jgi:AcrR family transcriptional regulator
MGLSRSSTQESGPAVAESEEGVPKKTKHAQRSEATRAELIRLGLERIPARGYAATSIRDLVAGSGQTKGAFDYHFPTKADFFLALIEARTGPSGAWAQVARDHPADSIEGAAAAVVSATAGGAGGWGEWILAMGDFARTDGAASPYRERLRQFYDHWVAEITGWIEVLQEQRVVRIDRPAETLAVMAFAAVEGHIVHQTIYGRSAELALQSIARILSP